MHPDFNLSDEGLNLALMGMAFTAGNMAVAKCLKELNEERKAVNGTSGTDDGDGGTYTYEEPSIDRFANLANAMEAAETEGETREEQGHERQPGFVDWCIFLAALNDEIEKRSKTTGTGRKWPIPQTVEGILAWKTKITPAPVQASQYDEMRILVAAYSGIDVKDVKLTDEELKPMIAEENTAKATFFATLFEQNREDIITRMHAGIANYNRFSETSWETMYSNFPPKVRYFLLGTIDMRLNSKITELYTGRRRDGTLSPGASRPAMLRATDMAILRADQAKVKAWRDSLSSQVE